MSNKSVRMNIEELKGFMGHIITNNRFLQQQGKIPVAIAVEGESGLGKTSAALQIAAEEGLDVVKLNLAQIEELGDLVGFPVRQFQMSLEDDTQWVNEPSIKEYSALGYRSTGKSQMGYCPPEWIADKNKGGILILDDFNRADQRFMQATMELVDRQKYLTWCLPPDWHIMLTNNPDDGNYNVTGLDVAQTTRYVDVTLKFDIGCWSRWAERENIDSRCINFLLMHRELVTTKVNPRSITTFFNCISSLPSFNTSLPLIQQIGEGSVGQEFSSLFTMFINNSLDKLMSPEEILITGEEKDVISRLKTSIGTGEKYRADVASVISTRMINFAGLHSKTNNIDNKFIDRIAAIVNSEIFMNDLKYMTVRNIFNSNITKFRGLALNKDLVKFVLSQ